MTDAIANNLQALLTARAKTMLRLRDVLVQVHDHIEDEGDRVYFGSTNDADTLKEVWQELDDWNWDAIMADGKLPDVYEASRKAHARAEKAERERDDARAANERDRTEIIVAVNALTDAFARRDWLIRGGRGSYEWDDDRFRDEFRDAMAEFEPHVDRLRRIGADRTDCPETWAEVLAARATAPAADHIPAAGKMVEPAAALVARETAVGDPQTNLPVTDDPQAAPEGQQCDRCQGNGEIVTDWDRYRHPHDGDVGDEAVAECPDCNGEGVIADHGAPEGQQEAVAKVLHTPPTVRVNEVLDEGDGFWRSCSGCHELNEGHPTGDYSATFRAHLGVGCRECGGLGVVWDTTDYAEMGEFLSRDPEAARRP